MTYKDAYCFPIERGPLSPTPQVTFRGRKISEPVIQYDPPSYYARNTTPAKKPSENAISMTSPPNSPAKRARDPARSKPPTVQPRGLARTNSSGTLNRSFQFPARPGDVPRPIMARNASFDKTLPPLPHGAKVPFPSGERTLFGVTKAPLPDLRPHEPWMKNKVPAPEDLRLDFEFIWERFVDQCLNSDEQAAREEKMSHPLGKLPPKHSPFHGVPVLEKHSSHNFSVIFNPEIVNLQDWAERTGLEKHVVHLDYMEELFYQVAERLNGSYGWLHQHTQPGTTALHYVLRPRTSPNSLGHVNMIFLPKSPKTFMSREGEYWRRSIEQQFATVKAHRHPSMGLVFHNWINTKEDVKANAEAVPPPIWFFLYAMQAAYPGVFVIREEAQNDLMIQTTERGLPPYELLSDRACGPFFAGLLGEEGYVAMCEAAVDARTSTKVDVLIKGSVRPRKRTTSNATADGLPPMPEKHGRRPSFNNLFKRPSWLKR